MEMAKEKNEKDKEMAEEKNEKDKEMAEKKNEKDTEMAEQKKDESDSESDGWSAYLNRRRRWRSFGKNPAKKAKTKEASK